MGLISRVSSRTYREISQNKKKTDQKDKKYKKPHRKYKLCGSNGVISARNRCTRATASLLLGTIRKCLTFARVNAEGISTKRGTRERPGGPRHGGRAMVKSSLLMPRSSLRSEGMNRLNTTENSTRNPSKP